MSTNFQNPDYQKIPNYRKSAPVQTMRAADLTPQDFQKEYVDRNRPCLIKGAATHWKACSSWQSKEYLKDKCAEVRVQLHDTPVVEADPILSSEEKRSWLTMHRFVSRPKWVQFAEFLDGMEAESLTDDALYFLYSIPMGPGAGMHPLAMDLGDYAFLPAERRAALDSYPRNNVFFYKSSLTDWHYHHSAEALQTQIVGTKEVLLLPPTESVWSYMHDLQDTRLSLYDADLSAYPQALQEVPLRAVLESGDALYIPIFWWHLVSTRGNRSLGATVPTWWHSPYQVQFDRRFPAVRAFISAMARNNAIPWWQRARIYPWLIGGLTKRFAWGLWHGS